jgi:death-on-curing protein
MFGQEMYPSIYEKAATYLYHIICNHPFNDANKRTGYAVTLVFLDVNGAKQTFKKEDLENLVIEIAKGNETKERIYKFLQYGHIAH